MIDLSFCCGSDFAGVIPSFTSTNRAEVSTKIFHDKHKSFDHNWKLCMVYHMYSIADIYQKILFCPFNFEIDKFIFGNTAV